MMHCKRVKIKSGYVWECVEDGVRDPKTGKRNQIKRRGKTQKEARQRVESAVKKSRNSHGLEITDDITFKELSNYWFQAYKKTGVKDNTIKSRKYSLSILFEEIGEMKVRHVKQIITLQKVINDLSEDYARETVKNVNVTVNLVFRYAIKNNIVYDNPTKHIEIPRENKTVEEIEKDNLEQTYMDAEEIAEFLDVLEEYGMPLDKERFLLMLFTGMRSGEVCSLQEDDLDFDNNTVNIIKTIYSETNKTENYVLTPPKTKSSIRKIDLDPYIMNMLKSRIKKNHKLKMKYRHLLDEYHDKRFVFCRENGYPFMVTNLNRRMSRLIKKTSIKKKLSPHSFRHTHISMLAEAGVELPAIMKRVGHADPGTTLKVYTHVTEKMKKDSSEKIINYGAHFLKNIIS